MCGQSSAGKGLSETSASKSYVTLLCHIFGCYIQIVKNCGQVYHSLRVYAVKYIHISID
ncbi:hypothetical protein MU1_50940 [Paenibacillus glycanilyticus]|uniref:Uncharacterized protein n=1 Tax=Paenibacillus glycanilyticus TaxID=126569 RepID=A0ABQ6GKI4_9BACL|nr:hypothetical protein MU1_50940 [Paenibacillus glycanilyticus]